MNENNYEVFISFKNKDLNGNPSNDSQIANSLFEEFSRRGIPAFYSNVKWKVFSGTLCLLQMFFATDADQDSRTGRSRNFWGKGCYPKPTSGSSHVSRGDCRLGECHRRQYPLP